MPEFEFTESEWEACVKVLTLLKDNPTRNPDNQTFKTLIKKIYKNNRKESRKQTGQENRREDIQALHESLIVKNVLLNRTEFVAREIEDTGFTPLHSPINCYACNSPFTYRHFFYSRLCPDCATDNYARRFASADLSGRNVILTGGRVKIGYATCLKLLQAGANLIVTTRFPALLSEALTREKEFEDWKDRVIVYGLDLRNLQAVEEFVRFVESRFDGLDILINNAAQTIKYPDEYYTPLILAEQQAAGQLSIQTPLFIENKTGVTTDTRQLPEIPREVFFEKNRFGQPVDRREKNSWNSTLEDISLHELLEVNLINQISPYLLLKGLKQLMCKSIHTERFVINVTSSEGQFSYENKTIFHPHTNMTKAALNMLTRTSAEEFAGSGIYMNSVDVGWVSTGAIESLRKRQAEVGYVPPLDPVDGASRIFDPVIQVLTNRQEPIYGKLIKNYKVIDW
ncbi:MAG: SDR family oxidoreductase [Tannerellaceae bacterium]|nr:SDR family oxidoreductase [Tannerellaceae bacterium]